MRFGFCIPVLNPRAEFISLVNALACQTVRVAKVLLIDSSPVPHPFLCGLSAPFVVQRIQGEIFDHGGTRRLALEGLADAEIIVFLTQDAVLANPAAICNLIACFGDETVGAAFGRQLPRPDAHPIESHARCFNYPRESRAKSAADIPALGLKAAFISNSFAAYRRDVLDSIGGFPERCIVSEDTYVAAKMILAGWKIAYCADAQVYHSHNYNWRQEFQRYFDIGVFHSREPWVRENFGNAEGEGIRFIKSELKYLLRQNPFLIPSALVRTPIKYFGFRAGLMGRYLPAGVKKKFSMQKAFWNREIGLGRGDAQGAS